jgi:hypothetical protein
MVNVQAFHFEVRFVFSESGTMSKHEWRFFRWTFGEDGNSIS